MHAFEKILVSIVYAHFLLDEPTAAVLLGIVVNNYLCAAKAPIRDTLCPHSCKLLVHIYTTFSKHVCLCTDVCTRTLISPYRALT
jgi:hypothetical protein